VIAAFDVVRARSGDTVDEFASAGQALVVLQHVVQTIGPDDMHRPTPCDDWDVQALADHLIDTMMNTYSDFGNPYTLFLAAHSQFG
jgi:hypothetical protein